MLVLIVIKVVCQLMFHLLNLFENTIPDFVSTLRMHILVEGNEEVGSQRSPPSAFNCCCVLHEQRFKKTSWDFLKTCVRIQPSHMIAVE